MECVSIKKSICTSVKYWYSNGAEALEHKWRMDEKGFKHKGTSYNVGRIKGQPKGLQFTYVKYEEYKEQ